MSESSVENKESTLKTSNTNDDSIDTTKKDGDVQETAPSVETEDKEVEEDPETKPEERDVDNNEVDEYKYLKTLYAKISTFQYLKVKEGQTPGNNWMYVGLNNFISDLLSGDLKINQTTIKFESEIHGEDVLSNLKLFFSLNPSKFNKDMEKFLDYNNLSNYFVNRTVNSNLIEKLNNIRKCAV